MANAVPVVTTANYSTLGYVQLNWTNATKDAAWYAWRLYRRSVGGNWVLLKEYLYDVAGYEYHDYTVPSNNGAYEYSVTEVYLVATVPTQRAHTPSASVSPVSTDYWLIHPFDESKTLHLYLVNQDDFEDEVDFAELKLLHRGRKVDQGTDWGVRGSLSCQLRDQGVGNPASLQLAMLRAAKEAGTYFYLRNPFGTVTRVALGPMTFQRVAGVGMNEYANVTFSYIEVTE